eukprot:2719754-Rhodomonas_salina.1
MEADRLVHVTSLAEPQHAALGPPTVHHGEPVAASNRTPEPALLAPEIVLKSGYFTGKGSFSTRTLKWTGRVPDIVHAAPNRRTGAVEMGDRVVGGEEEYDSNWSSDLGLDSKPTVTSRPHGEVSFASMREKFSGMAESQAQTGHEIQTLSMTEQDPTSDSLSPLSLLAFPHFNRRRIPKLVRPLRSELAILSSSAFLPSSCRGQVQYKYGIMHDFQDRDVTQASVQDTAQQ